MLALHEECLTGRYLFYRLKLLEGLLGFGLVKEGSVAGLCDFLQGHLTFLFLPAGVGIVNALDILSRNWEAILTACAVSTVAVIITVAIIQESFEKRRAAARQQSTAPKAES